MTKIGIGKRGLFEKGSFSKCRFSRDLGELRDSRDPPECGKNKGESDHFLQFFREFRDFRDSRDPFSEKTPSRNDPFSVPEAWQKRVTKQVTETSEK